MKTRKQNVALSMFVAGMVVYGIGIRLALAAPVAVGCGAILTSDTTLESDLSCPGREAALVIGADHITVNLNGHTLMGDFTGVGIDNTGGFDHVTIKDGTLVGFTEGIRAVEADGFRVNGVEVVGAMGDASATGAIHVLGGEDVQIRNCSITVEPTDFGPGGIRLDSVKKVLVQDSEIEGCWIGVSFFSVGPDGDPGLGAPTTGRIQGCKIRNSFQSAVLLGTTDDATVQDNELSGCSVAMQIGTIPEVGVLVRNVLVAGNTIHHNAGGIWVGTVVDSQISDNAVTDHPAFGINLREGCVNNNISGNLVANNMRGIVLIFGANNNRISENVVLDNRAEGITLFLGANTGNHISDNVAKGNGVWDLFHNEESTPNFWDNNSYDTKSGADIP